MQIYSSIEDLPIYNYFKVTRTGSLKYLIVGNSEALEKDLISAWESIQDEILEIDIQDDGFVTEIKEYKEHILLKISNKLMPTALNNILYKDSKTQFEDEKKDSKPFDFQGSMMIIAKFMGFRVDAKTFTTAEYFAALKLMKNGK